MGTSDRLENDRRSCRDRCYSAPAFLRISTTSSWPDAHIRTVIPELSVIPDLGSLVQQRLDDLGIPGCCSPHQSGSSQLVLWNSPWHPFPGAPVPFQNCRMRRHGSVRSNPPCPVHLRGCLSPGEPGRLLDVPCPPLAAGRSCPSCPGCPFWLLLSRSALTISICPSSEAAIKAVLPSLSLSLTLTPFSSRA